MYRQRNKRNAADREELLSSSVTPDAKTQTDAKYMGEEQLLQKGVATHQETTEIAKRGVEKVRQLNEIGGAVAQEVDDHGKKLDKINEDIEQIDVEVNHGKKVVKWLNTNWLLTFFCGCCLEPQRKHLQAQKHQQGNKYTAAPGQDMAHMGGGKKATAKNNAPQPAYGGPYVDDLPEKYRQQKEDIERETRKQNTYLDEMDQGLRNAKEVMLHMQDELQSQDGKLSDMNNRADKVVGKVGEVNTEMKKIVR